MVDCRIEVIFGFNYVESGLCFKLGGGRVSVIFMMILNFEIVEDL